jgi:hypothetical protein
MSMSMSTSMIGMETELVLCAGLTTRHCCLTDRSPFFVAHVTGANPSENWASTHVSELQVGESGTVVNTRLIPTSSQDKRL